MANRTFSQFQGTLQKGVVTLFAKVEINLSNGEPTLITSEEILGPQNPTTINPSAGFASVEKVGSASADVYVFHLQDPYVRLLHAASVEQIAGPTSYLDIPLRIAASFVDDQDDPQVGFKIASADITGGSGSTTALFMLTLANSTAL